jgi:diacylglycerol kinase
MNLTGIVEAQVDAVADHHHVILSAAKDPGF